MGTNMLDLFLARFKWWRQFKGGIWWNKRVLGDIETIWTNRQPLGYDRIEGYENYTKPSTAPILTQNEFVRQVINISRNGHWKHAEALAHYISVALILRTVGMDDKTIIDLLTELYWNTHKEGSDDKHEAREFEWSDIERMFK